ncbi:histidinol-phosphate transaminase [Paenibacillus selenitireducens]|uniref:Histidinol-phosphate aminotransferase n=1 Tax=Paenibacillus selenitireducens TaxID=1324314 RepID=A0A1T2XNV4_9BACL|nr:histidinol-phosphate transaminase [Paenibacillus selenitireducens]OPA81455.1 histidinol-phosphate transaminase [Paenibacillus selenitireducens]
MQPKSSIVNLPVYQPGKPIEDVKRELGLTEVIKLASNENPFGSSEKAKQAILNELQNMSIYPDGASVELANAIAKHHHVNANQIVFGAGSDEIILMITRAFIVAGDETIMADQTFPQYKHNTDIEGAVCVQVPLVDGKHDLPGMLARITEKTKVIWVCNPNNPTGTIVSKDELVAFLDQVPKHVLVVLDEAYCEYVKDPSFPDGLTLLPHYNNLITLRTFSKIYGLASLRIGYGIGDPAVIKLINQVREPFNTSRMAQAAALAAIDDQEFIDKCREANAAGIQYLEREFTRLGLTSFPAHGNFVMFDTKRDAAAVFNELMRKGVITRAGHKLYPTYIRVTVGSQAENTKFIQALEAVLKEVAAEVVR